ncbi:SPT16 protein, partial [Rhinopomastus cyanomelas]|nr:SPT16 protein [Rhinopomastus cyanomelas]
SGKNQTLQQMGIHAELKVVLNRLNDIPNVKNQLGHSRVENKENMKMAPKRKGKQRHNVEKASSKRKPAADESLVVNKKARADSPLTHSPQPQSSPPSPEDIETQLIHIDEEGISFEFVEHMVPSCSSSGHRGSEKAQCRHEPTGPAFPCIHRELWQTLQKGNTCFRNKDYEAALEKFSEAQQLCSKGTAMTNPYESSPEDIDSIASFIETKLTICYLKLENPDEALNHAHRSIILNPAYFRNHLRQAAAFRCLERYSEAARSTMIASYLYWLMGGSEQHTSELIKQYWQAMIEEAITSHDSFSVMYTPFAAEVKAAKIKSVFAKRHPNYLAQVHTDPHGLHVLPQSDNWPSLNPQQYSLTLGFKSYHLGRAIERLSKTTVPIFSERKSPYCLLTKRAAERYWDNTGKKVVPVMDFISSTKLTDDRCPCGRAIEKLHLASLLGHLERVDEQSQVLNQAMAELATLPYLQDLSQEDAELLQLLMADAMDTLEGESAPTRAWDRIQKVGLIEDFLYEAEDDYLKNKKLR